MFKSQTIICVVLADVSSKGGMERKLPSRTETLYQQMRLYLLDDGRAEPTDGVCGNQARSFVRYECFRQLQRKWASGRVRCLAGAFVA